MRVRFRCPAALAVTLGHCASLPLPALVSSLALLPLALALMGGFMGRPRRGHDPAGSGDRAALVGFAAVGAGISFTFPLLLSAAARLPGIPPSVAIAAISTAGYLGFLAGPPTIGLGAALVSLRASLGLVVALCALVAQMARIARPGGRPSGGGLQGTDV